jgi:GTP pyrophosphokinase
MGDANATGDAKYSTLQFTLEVRNRIHLAGVLRQLRNLPEVVRLTRVKSGLAKETRQESKPDSRNPEK